MAEERVQRRLAAILSADVVGYSRLMGIDETGTLARLKAMGRDFFDPLIAAHSGRIFKLMGDGALVEFASAVDAEQLHQPDLSLRKEVCLTVTTALNARRAGPDCAPTRHEIVDEFSERFERIDLSSVGSALPHKIDATAAQKDKNL